MVVHVYIFEVRLYKHQRDFHNVIASSLSSSVFFFISLLEVMRVWLRRRRRFLGCVDDCSR